MALTLHIPFKDRPSVDLSTTTAVGPALSITRANTGMMKDDTGFLRELQSGEARFPGASFSQNRVYSSDLQTYSSTSGTITGSQADPLGGTDAALFAEDTGTSAHSFIVNGRTPGAGHTVMFSMYAKTNGRDLQLVVASSILTAGFQNYDLTNGVIGNGNVDQAGMEDIGSGWYRCWFVQEVATSSGNINPASITGPTAARSESYTGDGSSGFYCYGPQSEDVSGAWDSENYHNYSNALSSGSWSKTRSSVTSGASDPFGGTDAWSLNSDATAGNTHWFNLSSGFTLPEPGRYMYSAYVKASGQSWVRLVATGFDVSSAGANVYFDVGTGAIGTANAVDSGIEAAGSGWYRCWFTFDHISGGDASGTVQVYIADGDNDSIFDGSSSEELVFYGGQIERCKPNQTAPSTYVNIATTTSITNYSPSTYIATTTAAVSSLSGSNDGLLVEEARTQILTDTEDLSTTWTANNATVSTNQTLAPDGSLTMDKIVDDGLGGTTVYVDQAVTVATSTAYTLSAFLKADQLSNAYIQVANFTTPADSEAWFDLSAGTVGTVDAGFDDSGIEDYGNGIYRCWVSFTTDGTDTAGNVRIGPAESDASVTVTSDGTSSIFATMAQLEAGAFPTSYIPNLASSGSVTRNADDVSTTDVSWFDDNQGTFYANAEFVNSAADSSNPILAPGAGDAGVNSMLIYGDGTNMHYTHNTGTGVDFNSAGSAAIASNTDYKVAFAFANDDIQIYLNGSSDASSSSVTVPSSTVFDNFKVGQNQSKSKQADGLIKEIAYFDERLDNSTLEQMSTDGSFPSTGHSGVGLSLGKIGAIGAQ